MVITALATVQEMTFITITEHPVIKGAPILTEAPSIIMAKTIAIRDARKRTLQEASTITINGVFIPVAAEKINQFKGGLIIMKTTIRYNNKNYNEVLIDTSSVLNDNFECFVKNFLPLLSNSNMSFTIPQAVMNEINRFCFESTQRGVSARRAKENIMALHNIGYIKFEGNPNTKEKADAYIISKILRARQASKKILVITQDVQLGKDILKTNSMYSTPAPANNVQRIGKYGNLENFDLSTNAVEFKTKYKNTNTATILKRFGL